MRESIRIGVIMIVIIGIISGVKGIDVGKGMIIRHMKEGMENISRDYSKEEVMIEMLRYIYVGIISVM